MATAPDDLLRPQPIPRPQAIDAAWVEGVLRDSGHAVTLTGLSVDPVGSGQIGETVRLRLTHAPGSDGPATLIGKFASADATSLAVARDWSLYEREVRFYRDLAPSARIALPRFFGGWMDAGGGFVLLLEDLAPARPGDQFAGLSDGDATRAVREAARLHGAFWDQGERPEFAWLDTAAKGQPFYTADIFRAVWPQFRDRYRDRLGDDHVRVCDRLAERYDVYDRPPSRPRCVTHNDYRPDNMLIGADRLVVVDWQSVALGSGTVDLAYLIGGGYAPDDRRAAEPGLVAAYRDELRRQGVDDGPDEAFDADYRRATFAGINVAVGAAMLVQRTERGDRLFLTMLDRHVSHVLDHDALSLLDE